MSPIDADPSPLKSIDQAEWDYRDLFGQDHEMRVATPYEYSRFVPWVEKAYVDWLDAKVDLSLSTKQRKLFGYSRQRLTPRQFLKKVQRLNPKSSEHQNAVELLFFELIYSMKEQLKGHVLAPSVLFLFDFPSPYMVIRQSEGFNATKAFDAVISEAANKGLLNQVQVPDWPFSYAQGVFQEAEEVVLHIDWKKTDGVLIQQFSEWLKRNRNKPESRKRLRMGHQLKCLSARTLKNHFKAKSKKVGDIAYELQSFLGGDFSSEARRVFTPYFEEQSQISRAESVAIELIHSTIACYWRYGEKIENPRVGVQWLPD